jgi:hypothetical protein
MKIHRTARSTVVASAAGLAVLVVASVGGVADTSTARSGASGRPAGVVWVGNRGTRLSPLSTRRPGNAC